MRDLVLTLLIFGALPFIFWRPYIGILLWSWLSYMNPHRQTWSYAYDMPFAQIVALVLLMAMVFRAGPFRLPAKPVLFVWIGLLLWMAVTTAFALFPDAAQGQLTKVYKIQLVTFLTMMLITDQRKINLLIAVIVASIGFYSVKGGLFTVLTGGAHRVYGPSGTYIEENNALAVATLMTIPLMYYLREIYANKPWLRHGAMVAMVLSLFSALGSQSRGALIAIAALAVFFWLKSKRKLVSALAMVVLGVGLLAFMPDSWWDRMDSIRNYQEDASAMGRINAWGYAINVASSRLTGAGFESWSVSSFARFAPDPSDVHAAHSIYFSILADHGWPGFLLYAAILVMTWRSLTRVEKAAASVGGLEDRELLARMLKVALVAYFSGGAFLSLAYFDLPWHLIAISLLLEWQLPAVTGVAASGVPLTGMQRSLPPAAVRGR